MAVLTPACGPHCVASKGGEGPHAHLLVKHCSCGMCHAGLSGDVITGSALPAPGGMSMSVGWGDQGIAQATALAEEGKADAAALTETRDQVNAEFFDQPIGEALEVCPACGRSVYGRYGPTCTHPWHAQP